MWWIISPYAPRMGGLRGGGFGKENLTLYSRGFESSSWGPSSSTSSTCYWSHMTITENHMTTVGGHMTTVGITWLQWQSHDPMLRYLASSFLFLTRCIFHLALLYQHNKYDCQLLQLRGMLNVLHVSWTGRGTSFAWAFSPEVEECARVPWWHTDSSRPTSTSAVVAHRQLSSH